MRKATAYAERACDVTMQRNRNRNRNRNRENKNAGRSPRRHLP